MVFLPHGYCISWQPWLLWTMAASDIVIGLSYFAIPAALMLFAVRQRELPYRWVIGLFALFIVACGTSHFISLANLWTPLYRVEAFAKLFTAGVSLLTAIAVWPLVPRLLTMLADHEADQARIAAANQALAAKNRQLEEAEARFRLTLTCAPIGIATLDLSGRFTAINHALTSMLGYTEQAMLGMTFQQITHPHDLAKDLALVDELIAGKRQHYTMEKRYLTHDGKVVPIQLDASLLRDERGRPVHFIAQVQNITQRLEMEAALRQKEAVMVRLLEDLQCAVVVHSTDTSIRYANAAAVAILGLNQDQIPGKVVPDAHWHFVREDQSDMPLAEYPVMRVIQTGETLKDNLIGVRSGQGLPLRWLLVSATPQADERGALRSVVVSFIEVTERQRLAAQLEHLAMTDPLTALPNRRHFMESAEREMARSSRTAQTASVMMIDVDRFKVVNDTRGHAAGDEVLRALAAVLQQCLRAGDLAGRIGGEEFCVLLPSTGLQEATAIAERMRGLAAAQSVQLDDGSCAFTVSIGLASQSGEGLRHADLIKRADEALYLAKRNGRNRVAFLEAPSAPAR